MRKICLALILSLATMCVCSVVAGAEETSGHYKAGVNSYSNDATSGAQTVMIYKVTENGSISAENIYYINQNDNDTGFSNLEMLMKRDAPEGDYALVTNKGKVATFTITKSEAAIVGSREMKCLNVIQKEGSYCAAYGISTNSMLTENAKLSMIVDGKDDKLYSINLNESNSIIQWLIGPVSSTQENITGKAIFAIQINGISNDYVTEDENGNITPKFNLYFQN